MMPNDKMKLFPSRVKSYVMNPIHLNCPLPTKLYLINPRFQIFDIIMNSAAEEVLREATAGGGGAECTQGGEAEASDEEYVEAEGGDTNDLTRPSEWTPLDKVSYSVIINKPGTQGSASNGKRGNFELIEICVQDSTLGQGCILFHRF